MKKIAGVSSNLSKSISEDISVNNHSNSITLDEKRIAISVSNSSEFLELGYSKIHQKDITVEITRYLLSNGFHLVYGGDLREDGYTYAFSELAFQYRVKSNSSKNYYSNYFAWPIYLSLKNSDEANFKRNRVEVIKVGCPTQVEKKLRETIILPDTIDNCFYWAISLSKMREEMTKNTDARIIIGGKTSEFKGFYPGLIEEAFLTIKQKKPLYLVGAFSGATQFIIKAIKGEDTKRLSEEIFSLNPLLSDLYSFSTSKLYSIPSLQDILDQFKKLGLKGLCKLNKLNNDDNELLFETKHFHEIILHVIIGLNRTINFKQ